MERKTIFVYAGIVIVGLGLMVGMVLYLRSRNAPAELPLSKPSAGTVRGTSSNQPGVRPFTPLDKAPYMPPYKTGDPRPSSTSPFLPVYQGFNQMQPSSTTP